jgi:hypothetical protein
MPVAKHVADALEGLPAAQQVDGQRVTQDMGARRGVTMPALSSWQPSQGFSLLRSGP